MTIDLTALSYKSETISCSTEGAGCPPPPLSGWSFHFKSYCGCPGRKQGSLGLVTISGIIGDPYRLRRHPVCSTIRCGTARRRLSAAAVRGGISTSNPIAIRPQIKQSSLGLVTISGMIGEGRGKKVPIFRHKCRSFGATLSFESPPTSRLLGR
jgi:hypothetical protein